MNLQSNNRGLSEDKLVFKYRGLDERALQIITKRELHFSAPSSLNDPFECDLESLVEGSTHQLENLWEQCRDEFIAVRQAEELEYVRYRDGFADPRDKRNDHNFWRKRFDDNSGRDSVLDFIDEHDSLLAADRAEGAPARRNAVLKDFYAALIRDSKRRFGICSMAGDAKSILMWSHYAANHMGLVLVFDTKTRIFEKQPGISHRAVTYSRERKVNVAKEGWPESFIQLYTRKAEGWAYEKESRYISHNGPGPKKYKRHTLKGIILGCRFAENLTSAPKRKLVEDLFNILAKENQERRSGSKIQIYLAQKVQGAFALNLKRLHDTAALHAHFGLSQQPDETARAEVGI